LVEDGVAAHGDGGEGNRVIVLLGGGCCFFVLSVADRQI
jgi:hypothetical protein